MKSIELRAQPRTLIGKQVKLLRHQSVVPGVVYGHHIDPVAVQFDSKELTGTEACRHQCYRPAPGRGGTESPTWRSFAMCSTIPSVRTSRTSTFRRSA